MSGGGLAQGEPEGSAHLLRWTWLEPRTGSRERSPLAAPRRDADPPGCTVRTA